MNAGNCPHCGHPYNSQNDQLLAIEYARRQMEASQLLANIIQSNANMVAYPSEQSILAARAVQYQSGGCSGPPQC